MKRYRTLALVALSAGCSGGPFRPAEPDPLPAETTSPAVGLRVEGVVTDRWGYVVPDAWITVRVGSPNDGSALPTDCAGATHLPTRTRSSAMGRFAVTVEAGRRPPFSACLEIEALPPRGFGLREDQVVVPSATFTPEGATGGGEPVRVHIVLL